VRERRGRPTAAPREIKLINFTYSRIKRGVHALIYSRRARPPSSSLSLSHTERRTTAKYKEFSPTIYLQPRLNLIKRELLFLEAEISHVLLSLGDKRPSAAFFNSLLVSGEFHLYMHVYCGAGERGTLSKKLKSADYEPRCGFWIKMVSKSLAYAFVSTHFSLKPNLWAADQERNASLQVDVNYFTHFCGTTII
jgi:hypothetical protein